MKIVDYFGRDVFSDKEMKARLSEDVYKKLKKTIEDGVELAPGIADKVASAMKDWAVEHGATHYTHWFQPLTEISAEKLDSFLSISKDQNKIMDFSGKNLISGESDASSFPSGGLRATFEARGYTAWDCTSPAFLREDALGVTLCIPTVFCSYTGQSLDLKTPLLRSIQALDTQAMRIIRLFGNKTSRHVVPMVGAEQEYFLVDKDIHDERTDLVYTGHTLFGAMAPKGQELDDHYCGVISERVGAYMKDLNEELWALGVPAKTQHNEAAPSQHELAPIYEQANIATDHNQMTMEIMRKVAERHNLVCLLHEKPFAGVNGSGKHNNWSISTDDGINLLKPCCKPHEDLQFLLILTSVIAAVDEHADLLRQSAANAGNDLRLGANEAPPAIVSIFLGEQLQDILDQVSEKGTATCSKKGGKIDTGVGSLPNFEKDASDRNRTSPLAFTGNKFEFRMLGSMASIASVNVVLNTIVAEVFKNAADELEDAEAKDFDEKVKDIIKRLYTEHSRVVFNGDGYSEAWVKEAKKRKLPNNPSMVDAIPALTTEKSVKLFEEFGVFNREELESRAEIEYDIYSKQINIEARTMIDIASKQIIPAVIEYLGVVSQSVVSIKAAVPGASVTAETYIIKKASKLLSDVKKALEALEKVTAQAQTAESVKEKAKLFHDNVVPAMAALRAPVDALEMIVGREYWPMPDYGELIFR